MVDQLFYVVVYDMLMEIIEDVGDEVQMLDLVCWIVDFVLNVKCKFKFGLVVLVVGENELVIKVLEVVVAKSWYVVMLILNELLLLSQVLVNGGDVQWVLVLVGEIVKCFFDQDIMQFFIKVLSVQVQSKFGNEVVVIVLMDELKSWVDDVSLDENGKLFLVCVVLIVGQFEYGQ